MPSYSIIQLYHTTYYASIIKYLQKKRAGLMMDVIEHRGVAVGWAHQQGASTSGSMLAWKSQSKGRCRSTAVWQKRLCSHYSDEISPAKEC